MKQVDRGNYVTSSAYMDAPQSIGYGVTISAPHMVSTYNFDILPPDLDHFSKIMQPLYVQHAYALELLKDKLVDGEKALDVGSGSGYLTVCMALMVGPNGRAVGIDHIPELVNKSIRNVQNDKPELLASGRVQLIGKFLLNINVIHLQQMCKNLYSHLSILVGDGREGYIPEAPYNAIHVGAAAPSLPVEVRIYE